MVKNTGRSFGGYGPTKTLADSLGPRRERVPSDWVEFFEQNYKSGDGIAHDRRGLLVLGNEEVDTGAKPGRVGSPIAARLDAAGARSRRSRSLPNQNERCRRGKWPWLTLARRSHDCLAPGHTRVGRRRRRVIAVFMIGELDSVCAHDVQRSFARYQATPN